MPSRTDQNWRHGAVMLDQQHTRFALWAPDAKEVSVEFENGPAQALQPKEDGWFVLDAACAAGTRYRYRVTLDPENTLTVPDPASRAQDGDVHGYSIVVDQSAYQWQNPGWQGRPWHEAVIYELHAGVLSSVSSIWSIPASPPSN
jgi:maltooligosyltrehalose trehalohydrolase